MKVGFGCDHTAVELKNILMEHLTEKGYAPFFADIRVVPALAD